MPVFRKLDIRITKIKLEFRLVGGGYGLYSKSDYANIEKTCGNKQMYPCDRGKTSMAAANPILDKVKEKSRGMGVVRCLIDKKHI